jgi:signal peptidase
VLGATLAVAWFFLLRPVALGGPASYVIVSGISMEPHLHTGDLVIVQKSDQYHVGDLVAYKVPQGQPLAGNLVIHRIIGGDATAGFVVKGDNNNGPDPWHPRAADIVGKSWAAFPGSGRLLLIARQPLVLAALLGGLAGLWVFTSGSGKGPEPRPSSGRTLVPWRRPRKRVASDEVQEA